MAFIYVKEPQTIRDLGTGHISVPFEPTRQTVEQLVPRIIAATPRDDRINTLSFWGVNIARAIFSYIDTHRGGGRLQDLRPRFSNAPLAEAYFMDCNFPNNGTERERARIHANTLMSVFLYTRQVRISRSGSERHPWAVSWIRNEDGTSAD